MKIILGSSSPRRKAILGNIIDNFEIIIPQIIEIPLTGESPQQFSERISDEKGRSIIQLVSNNSDYLIISCDTIVKINNNIIGKPADYQDAVNIINILTGKTHEVISSITLIYYDNDVKLSLTDSEISHVTFKNLTDFEIINYLNKFNYSDKAGAYAVQEFGDLIIDHIDGSLSNVIGFPLRLFFRMLNQLNLCYKIF